jgi:hypothetical protein
VISRWPILWGTANPMNEFVAKKSFRRGARYSQELGDQFTARLLRSGTELDQTDPETAVRAAFNTVFSTLVIRTAYGPEFGTPSATMRPSSRRSARSSSATSSGIECPRDAPTRPYGVGDGAALECL